MAEQRHVVSAMTDAQLLARVWDWAGQAVEPIDAPAIARGAGSRRALRSSLALRVTTSGILAPSAWWPAFGVILLLALLTALAAGALLVGSQRRDISEQRLPAPFGPARNGMIVNIVGGGANGEGSLQQVDLATGRTKELLGGSYVWPLFASDGQRLLFLEFGRSPRWFGSISVINADGSGAHRILTGGDYAVPTWAPDSHRIAVASPPWSTVNSPSRVSIVDIHSGASARFDVELPVLDLAWRPDHDQLVLRQAVLDARGDPGEYHGLYLINDDGTDRRLIRQLSDGGSPFLVSPDGSTIAYGQGRRIHLLDIDTGVDRELTVEGGGAPGEGPVAFSPDGARLLIGQVTGDRSTGDRRCSSVPSNIYCAFFRHGVVPVVGGPVTWLGSDEHQSIGGADSEAMFSPDGTQILVSYVQNPAGAWLFDSATGGGEPLPWWRGGIGTWQRLAP